MTAHATARVEVVLEGDDGERFVWAGPLKTLGVERPPRLRDDDEGWLDFEPGPELTVSLTFDEAELTERPSLRGPQP